MRLHSVARIAAIAFPALASFGCREVVEVQSLPDRAVGAPPGWSASVGDSHYYEIGLYRIEHHGGHSSLYLDGPPVINADTAVVDQRIKADNYRGKRVRFEAWVRSQDLNGPIAGLWMRVDGPGVVSGYDNMTSRPVKGTLGWHIVSVVLDVPSDAIGITFGAMLRGGGPLYSGFMLIDDMKFEIVGTDVASTNMYSSPVATGIDPSTTTALYLSASTAPTNLDFELIPSSTVILR